VLTPELSFLFTRVAAQHTRAKEACATSKDLHAWCREFLIRRRELRRHPNRRRDPPLQCRQCASTKVPDHPDAAYDRWLYHDEPFINDLCLMVLVAIRHEVERELVSLAARVTDNQRTLSGAQYHDRLNDERQHLREKKGWARLSAKLHLESFSAWQGSMNILRHLVNSIKHEPTEGPGPDLLKELKLDPKRNYMTLPEGGAVQDAIAASLGLKDADYCAITEGFILEAEAFLAAVARQPGFSPVEHGAASLSPDNFSY
jgi:hypothetical protein